MAGNDGEAVDCAFTRLYRQHHNQLRSYARCLTDAADVDDLVSDTFIVALQRPAEIPEGRERKWLLGVARNIARTRRRSRDRSLRFVRLLARLQPSPTTDLAAGRLSLEDSDLVITALQQLCPNDQELVVLSNWHDVSPGDLAAMLGISPAAARVRLHRARSRFVANVERLQAGVDNA